MKKIILSSAFLVLGTFAFSQQATKADRKANFEEKQQERLTQLKTDLKLTDAQVAQIKTLQDQKMETNKAERKQMMDAKRSDMKVKMEQYDQDMKKILTPDQYTKWQEMKQQRMSERKAKMSMKKDK